MPRTIQRLQSKKYNLKNIRRFLGFSTLAVSEKLVDPIEMTYGSFRCFQRSSKKITVSSLMPRTTNKIEHAYNKQIEFTFHYAK